MELPKPTSIKSEQQKRDALAEYRAEQEAQLEQMAHLRALRLSRKRDS